MKLVKFAVMSAASVVGVAWVLRKAGWNVRPLT